MGKILDKQRRVSLENLEECEERGKNIIEVLKDKIELEILERKVL